MLVDHERVLVRLKEHLLSKPHHGQKDLLEAITRFEVEALTDDEGAYRAFLRRFGVEFEEAFLGLMPTHRTPPGHSEAAASADGITEGAHPSNGHTATEDHHEHPRAGPPDAARGEDPRRARDGAAGRRPRPVHG